ncbi:acyl-CoA dehydrogenase [Clostridium estertheticum]|uniref:acyl-CoA dehydrogenase n=1 Tax=Clostridium estertheticum TaxID=238834 RepID=UPI001CF51B8F|nr:acyl-CoA dehydrogenase [Clostridium estertheticum]MCB2309017.1 acyl-CoA dehydrogenase [Clostridium estertheticum]MCB2346849.1 acyl-CoA dehydrogenase [Clostridium estertheticum]MCB2351839.1 acyl-CoA dehydrogenase [Clostridium estertheticum]WAG48442.1 acyl-CoA dehydrogenase [Clostridium estertheticum]
MNIIIEQLRVIQFKGITEQLIKFGKVTNIYGENGTGKTTIPDAFTFLLFDKDSKDSAKFDAQPLDSNNNPIHNLETVIEATLNIDGKQVVLKRIYKEKYTKIKGTSKLDFKGHESEYYVNDVPMKVTEYKKYIGSLLNEDTFKLLTSPTYFASLDKKKRMEIITEIVGDLDNMTVLDSKEELEPLRKHLIEHTVNELMKMTRSKVNKLKEDRIKLPTRIDEATKSIQEFDFDALEIQRAATESDIKSIDEQLLDKSKENEGLYTLKSEFRNKESELSDLEYRIMANKNKPRESIESDIRTKEASIRHLNVVLDEHKKLLHEKKSQIDSELKYKKASLLEKYHAIKNSIFEFDEESCKCPTCLRKFETENIEAKKIELEDNFNINKARKIEENVTAGKAITLEIDTINKQIIDLDNKTEEQKGALALIQKSLDVKKEELELLKTTPAGDSPETKKIKTEIETLEDKIKNYKAADTTELTAKKVELKISLKEVENQLAFKDANEKTLKRIETLKAEELKVSETIAELEGIEILSEEFIRTKVQLLEETVNSKFKYVTFKMFRNQNNGGLEEVCEPCINGVPFASNLNTAAKINAGLDIINTLCTHYGVNAPIFIDNKESVNKIIDVDSQVINLIVSKDKKLKIEVL